jgi:hypothetical protein
MHFFRGLPDRGSLGVAGRRNVRRCCGIHGAPEPSRGQRVGASNRGDRTSLHDRRTLTQVTEAPRRRISHRAPVRPAPRLRWMVTGSVSDGASGASIVLAGLTRGHDVPLEQDGVRRARPPRNASGQETPPHPLRTASTWRSPSVRADAASVRRSSHPAPVGTGDAPYSRIHHVPAIFCKVRPISTTTPRQCAMFENREYCPSNATEMVSVRPLRCLATMRSASPARGDSLS